MTPTKINLKIYQGSTFQESIRWEASRKVYKEITNISKSAPCSITAVGHALPEGWRFKVTNVLGMTDINSAELYHIGTVVDSDTIEINNLNSVGYKDYTSGGILEYNEPVDITGYTAKLHIRDTVSSDTTILELTTENGGILIDEVNKGIIITITAATTSTLTFPSAVYSLELISPSGVVSVIALGSISLVKDATR